MTNESTRSDVRADLPGPPAQKNRFRWVFLTVQAVFVLWIVVGIAGASGTPDNCGQIDTGVCNDLQTAGAAIGVAVVMFLWAFVDVIMLAVWLVFRKK